MSNAHCTGSPSSTPRRKKEKKVRPLASAIVGFWLTSHMLLAIESRHVTTTSTSTSQPKLETLTATAPSPVKLPTPDCPVAPVRGARRALCCALLSRCEQSVPCFVDHGQSAPEAVRGAGALCDFTETCTTNSIITHLSISWFSLHNLPARDVRHLIQLPMVSRLFVDAAPAKTQMSRHRPPCRLRGRPVAVEPRAGHMLM